MEDKKIISLFWDRDEHAISALQAKHGHGIRRTARNILVDRRDTEEAESDTYLAVWKAIPPAMPDPLSTFVYRIARYCALGILRRRSAQKRDAGYEVCLDELADTETYHVRVILRDSANRLVLFLYREGYYNRECENPNAAEANKTGCFFCAGIGLVTIFAPWPYPRA